MAILHWKQGLLCDKITSSPTDKILDVTKLKTFADDKLKTVETVGFVLDKVEKIVGEGENADCQHFLLLPQCVQKNAFQGSL